MRTSLATSFFALLLVFSSPHALAFDVEGFHTGMPKAAVIALAEKVYRVSAVDENTSIANGAGGGYLSFNFCEDRLVSIQQGFPPNLQQVTLLISELKRKHGNPFSTNAERLPIQAVPYMSGEPGGTQEKSSSASTTPVQRREIV